MHTHQEVLRILAQELLVPSTVEIYPMVLGRKINERLQTDVQKVNK